MMKNTFIFYLVLTLGFICSVSSTAHKSIFQDFKYITTSNGLENKTVTAILQDKKGFMWFGTKDGLYKYNGYELKLVWKSFFAKDGVMNTVHRIIEDNKNEQLLLLVRNSLFTLDLHTDSITQVKELCKEKIQAICLDKKQRCLIFIKEKGTFIYDTDNHKINKIKDLKELDNRDIISIKQDSAGNYYFLTVMKGIIFYNSHTKKTTEYLQGKIFNTSFCIDSKNNLWLGTGDGFFLWNRQRGEFERIVLDCKNKIALTITDIQEKDPGHIYIASNNGLYIYFSEEKTVIHLKHDSSTSGTLNYNYIKTIFFDKERTLWVGTYFGGVNYMAENSQNFQKYDFINNEMGGKVISDFKEDKDGNIWISTEDGGISVYNPHTRQTTNYNPLESDNTFLDFYNVHCLLFDNDTLFLGLANTGVSAYNIKEKTVRKITSSRPQSQQWIKHSVFSLTKINENEIAIGTPYGINIYNQRTDLVYHVKEIPKRNVTCIKKDSQGGLWACGWNLGIYYKPQGGHWTDFCANNKNIPTKVVYTLTQYGENIYIGTQNHGVVSYNLKTNRYQMILEDDLKECSVFNIIPYEQDLWFCTSNGLYQYDLTNSTYRHYGEVNGIKSIKACYNSGFVTSNGDIFIGTINGLNGFNPNDLIINNNAPTTFFTDLKINNELITPLTSKSPLVQIMPYTSEITVNNNQSNITIKFSSSCYYGKEGVIYKYKLLPGDKLWNYTHSNSLNFSNLASGKYSLMVHSCNSDGIWDNKGTQLNITVLPPWWRSWYMILSYTIFLILYVSWQINHFRTKQKRQIEKLNIQKSQEVYQSKLEFFTNMIHEIRTPLTLILSPLQVLRKREDTTPFRFELDMIQRNSERLLNNINQLMDFRKAEQDVSVFKDFEPIDIAKEIIEISDDFKFVAKNKGVALRITDECGEFPCMILGEKEIINKIFSNIISNALKFTKSEINIRIERKKGHVSISVQDDGVGISKELHEHIFEPFYQVREHLPKDYIGTGIGLSIVKNLVKKLKGELHLNSKVGQGAVFTIILPLYEIMEEKEKSVQTEIKGEVLNGTDSVKCIAIVEDNDDMRSFIATLLRDKYEVVEYSDGYEILKNIEKERWDVVLSDIMMPRMDGYELCERLKNDPMTSHIPVILLTAKILEEDEIKGLEKGADAYIRKPFTPEILLVQIENLIANRERLLASFREEPTTQLIDVVEDNKDKEFVAKVNEVIYKNLSNPNLSVQLVASELCVSRSLFFIKIKSLSGMTFTDYVRIARLKRAVELLKEGVYTVNEISVITGFSSTSYFCKSFKKQFHVSTSDYLKKNSCPRLDENKE